jgi:RND family efflux transporter MFP subunit
MKIRLFVLLMCAAAFTACAPTQEADSGPSHGESEDDSWAVAAWGESFGLFPEVDALVAGEASGAHVHVTLLDGFRPATSGRVAFVLVDSSGREERFSSDSVLRAGIFVVEVKPSREGERELRFEIEVEGISETIDGGVVKVGTIDSPGGLVLSPHQTPRHDEGEPVSFLLEQQWRTAFSSAWAQEGFLRPSVSGHARVEPPSGGEVVLTAPVDGVLMAPDWPFVGKKIARGSQTVEIVPTAPSEDSLAELQASVRELEALSEVADNRLDRLEKLLAREAVSRREVEVAQAEATGLQARFEAARSELAAAEAGRRGGKGVDGLTLRSPFAGRVAEVLVSPGEHVSAGTPLVRVVRERPVWLRVALRPADAALLGETVKGLVLSTGADAGLTEVDENNLRLVAVAPEVDAESGTVDALVEVDLNVDKLKPGLRAAVELFLPGEITGVMLPDSAVVDDAGVSVVYVQIDGESFSRREVTVVHRQGGRVLVENVHPGERVVVIGGAALRRASLLSSGQVEGHVH